MIGRILQRAIGAHIVPPANVLIDQNIETYPEVNFLKGQVHYRCKNYKFYTCAERKELFGCNCGDCHYKKAKERALQEPTFFNPMSLYYTLMGQGIKDLPLRIVDEAHSLLSLLAQISTKSFAKDKWFYPEDATNEQVFSRWLYKQIISMAKLLADLKSSRRQNHKKIIEINRELQQMKFILTQFTENTEQFILYEETTMVRGQRKYYLKLAPVTVPRTLITQILGIEKVVLMSGTMFSEDIKDLVGEEPYTYHEINSPIPIAQRPVFFAPTGTMNMSTPIDTMYSRIVKILDKHPGLNTLIHVTYSMQQQLLPMFQAAYPLVHFNTDEDKPQVIQNFIIQGGIFLAAGCSEGLDFKDDICRLNIIPKLDMPNIMDRVILKRRSLPNGDVWFAQQILKLTIQRLGRSTRNETDWSYSYILDPMWPRVIKEAGGLPKYIEESMVWHS